MENDGDIATPKPSEPHATTIERDGRRAVDREPHSAAVELAENAGQVVSRDRLLERVWGFSFAGGTRTVDVHVAQLRKKLARPDLIETVRGVGYRAREDRPPREA